MSASTAESDSHVTGRMRDTTLPTICLHDTGIAGVLVTVLQTHSVGSDIRKDGYYLTQVCVTQHYTAIYMCVTLVIFLEYKATYRNTHV